MRRRSIDQSSDVKCESERAARARGKRSRAGSRYRIGREGEGGGRGSLTYCSVAATGRQGGGGGARGGRPSEAESRSQGGGGAERERRDGGRSGGSAASERARAVSAGDPAGSDPPVARPPRSGPSPPHHDRPIRVTADEAARGLVGPDHPVSAGSRLTGPPRQSPASRGIREQPRRVRGPDPPPGPPGPGPENPPAPPPPDHRS